MLIRQVISLFMSDIVKSKSCLDAETLDPHKECSGLIHVPCN